MCFHKYLQSCINQHNCDTEHFHHPQKIPMSLCSQFCPPTPLATTDLLSISFARIFKLVIISLQKVVKMVMIPVLNLVNLQGSDFSLSHSVSLSIRLFINSENRSCVPGTELDVWIQNLKRYLCPQRIHSLIRGEP